MIDLENNKPEELMHIDGSQAIYIVKYYKVRFKDGTHYHVKQDGRCAYADRQVVVEKKSRGGWLCKMFSFLAIALLSMNVGCGINHRVSGSTDHDAKAIVKLMKVCDKDALLICKDDCPTIEDKLQCVKYACEFNGSLEVLGVSEENLGSILDDIEGGSDE